MRKVLRRILLPLFFNGKKLAKTMEKSLVETPKTVVKVKKEDQLPKYVLSLSLHDIVYADDPDYPLSLKEVDFLKSLRSDQCCLLLVDVWEPSGDKLHQQRIREVLPNVLKVLEAARQHEVFVVHAPSFKPEADGIEVKQGEMLLQTGDGVPDGVKLSMALEERGIDTIFYVGFAANFCVIDNEAGMREMSARRFNCILIRDCTAAIEYPSTVNGTMAHKVAINRIEYLYGSSCSSEGFINGFREVKDACERGLLWGLGIIWPIHELAQMLGD